MSSVMQAPSAEAQGEMQSAGRQPFSPSAYLLLVQGVYYFLTGVWPLVSIDTFQMVTGPKMDLWLVQTVGALIGVIGAVMLAGVLRRHAAAEMILLSMASALALMAVDVVFVMRQAIDQIYLLDAAAEAVLVVAWLVVLVFEANTVWKRSESCL